MIKIKNLNKIYGNNANTFHALKGIDFDVEKGDFVSIMGCSGSGKTTLMNILGCLDKPTSGSYYLNNQQISTLSNDAMSDIRNKNIGFVFQSFHLLPKLSALQNIELPMVYGGVNQARRRKKALKILDMVGLSCKANSIPNELSGGQRQRIAIGRALCNDPQLILADEPTGNLDSKTSDEIMKILKKLNSDSTTIVLITHEREIARYTNRTLTLKDGEFIK